MTKPLLFLFLVISTTACSSLLYHPTFYQHADPLKVHDKVIYKPIEIVTEDGVKLSAWHFLSQAEKSKKGIIVFFHGNGENLSSHFLSLFWILEYGYDYVIFDYRGYWNSEGKPSPEGTVKDGKSALKWAKDQYPQVPLIVFGQSLGGAVALKSVIETKGEIQPKAVVVDSTFAYYTSAGRYVLSRHWLTWLFQPLAYVLLSDRDAPGDRIAEISPTPLLVIHGQKDKMIELSLGKRVFELARDPKEFWEIPNGHHTDGFWRHEAQYRKAFVKYLEEKTAAK